MTRPRPWYLCLALAAFFLWAAWTFERRGDADFQAVWMAVMAGINLGMLVERHRP